MLTWLLNGYVIATRPNASAFTSGNVMLGYMDTFTSIANPREQNFVIFDNVRVVNLDAEAPVPKSRSKRRTRKPRTGANTVLSPFHERTRPRRR